MLALCAATSAGALTASPTPMFSAAKAFDISRPVRDIARTPPVVAQFNPFASYEVRPELGPAVPDRGYAGDAALQGAGSPWQIGGSSFATTPSLTANFEGLSNADNFTLFGFRVNPPDPVGAVGPEHYVQMVNLAFAVYNKNGKRLLGPVAIGSLWSGFPVVDCTDPSGDPIVLYDKFADRWLLTQFTTRGPTYYNCVAISVSGDPTGAYYRYAFTAGSFFPDYPKYGVWTDSYLLTSRDFGPANAYGISVYALEKSKMVAGNPAARAVRFFLDSDIIPINLMGDGLLPADIDGRTLPPARTPAPIIGTQDDNGPYGATFDALNVWELSVDWNAAPATGSGNPSPSAVLALVAQLPVAAFDSAFPCAPGARDCLPQPGIVNPDQFLDVLSYRQRPLWRLAYRNFGNFEALVTSQAVEARPALAGMRWYEIRRTGATGASAYSVYQQGTYAPNDGVHRWMGSLAMDARGNIAMGYSVVNGVDVYPGIRYTGRLSGDPLGQMTLGEGVIMNGSGVQRTTNSRWGDYTSMNVDPIDDCTFWYVNEYYTLAGELSSTAGWQTRIAGFRFPGCSR